MFLPEAKYYILLRPMSRTKTLSWRKVDLLVHPPLLVHTVTRRVAIIQIQSLPAPESTEAYLQQLDAVPDHNAFQRRPYVSHFTNSLFDERRPVVPTRDNSSS